MRYTLQVLDDNQATSLLQMVQPVFPHDDLDKAIYGSANLFVSDGSQFSTGGAPNPTVTIVALAIRQTDYMAEQMQAGVL
jgi:hypothetical protein